MLLANSRLSRSDFFFFGSFDTLLFSPEHFAFPHDVCFFFLPLLFERIDGASLVIEHQEVRVGLA